MFALPILLMVLAAPQDGARNDPPRVVVVQSQPQPQEGSQDADGEPAEDEAGDKAVLKFEGLRSLSERDVVAALLQGRLEFDKPFVYNAAKIRKAARVVREYLASEGFLHARVGVREERAAIPYIVTLVVDEGARARIADIRFEGNKAVPSARLAEAVRGCLDRSFGRREAERDLYIPPMVEYCMSAAGGLKVLQSEGYLKAEVGKFTVEETPSGIVLTTPVREGLRYRLGKIEVEGVTAFFPEQVVEMLGIYPGDVVNNVKVAEFFFERLRDEYGQRGYVQYEPDITPVFRPAARGKRHGTVDLEVQISEGKIFTVSSISFVGNRLKTADELKSALSLREGDVYDRRRFREGLAKLARMGAYPEGGVNIESGVQITLDEEKGLAEIKIFIEEEHL